RRGGDTAAAERQGSPPAQKPLALYSGIVTVNPDGTAEIVFDIPDFAGTARVMAVAWSRDKVGRANGDVVIRDPVVLTATLPRFLLNGDRGTMHLDLDNVEGGAGEYRVQVQSTGVDVVGNAAPQTLRLNARQRSAVTVPLTAAAAGIANVSVRISGPANLTMERNYTLAVKPATQILARRTVRPIARGEAITLSNDLFADLVPGTGSVSVSVGLWSSGGNDVWLDAYVTDFLTRAKERGLAVPDTAFKLALERLRNFVNNAENPSKNGGRNLAYALYVLARNGAAPIGDLRYFADTKLDDFATTIAKAQLAAALGMLGDRARAERVYGAALRSLSPQPVLEYGRTDYGSVLRDASALVTLAAEGGAPRATITGAVERVE